MLRASENEPLKNLFIPITKVDAVQRIVYGVAAVEEVDKTNEIFDYATSKPLFEAWSAEAQKFSQGKSLGNVRAMHGKVAAGRLDQLTFNDDALQVEVAAKIVDDNEWQKVEEGVYTGFSIGGKYEKRWKDGDYTRYTASPSEVSIVDNPCQPSARFTMTKADGSQEEREFASVIKEEGQMASNDQVAARARELAKAAGDETKWASFVEKARTELDPPDQPVAVAVAEAPAVQAETPAEVPAASKVEEPAVAKDATPSNPTDELAQVWQAKDGKTFAKKADAVAHNDTLAKAAEPTLAGALAELTQAVEKAEQPAQDPVLAKLGDFDGAYWLEKKDYSDDKRKSMADSGQAMKDGSFPIADKADLKNAVEAYGRAKDKVAAKKHIVARAKALDATDQLPADWEGSTAKADKAAGPMNLLKSFRTKDAARLEKGLHTVGRLACLIAELEWLQQEVEWEEMAEKDGSTLAQEVKEDIANLCNTLRNMVAEETAELFNDEEMDVYGEMLEMAHLPRGFDAVAKVLGDKVPGNLAKAGARHSKADLAKVQAMHDTSVDLGADCAGGTEKSAPAGDLVKVTAERDDLAKQVTDALPLIKSLAERLKKIEDQPAPRPGSENGVTLRVVDKAADDERVSADLLADLAKNNPGVIAESLIRLAQQRPQQMQPSR